MSSAHRFRQMIQETIRSGSGKEAFYAMNMDAVLERHQLWQQTLPNLRPFYAVKCNPSPLVMETMAGLGVGFDCASVSEIDSVLDMGVPAADIIFGNPCKTRDSISHAAALGVDMIVFDNQEDLKVMRELFPHARLVLRIKADVSHASNRMVQKYGAEMSDVPALMQSAKSLGLNVMGVCFHVGTHLKGCESPQQMRSTIAAARRAFDCGRQHGFDMSLLDVGGGFPGGSGEDSMQLFGAIAAAVKESIAEHFSPSDYPNVTVIGEPGRFLVKSAFSLSTMIITKKTETDDDGQEVINYYLMDGLYGSFNSGTFAAGQGPDPLIDDCWRGRPVKQSRVWGPTCDSLDVIHKNIQLPELTVGEWLTFPDMGAYTSCLGTRFNGFSLPPLFKCCSSREAVELLMKARNWQRLAPHLGLTAAQAGSMSAQEMAERVSLVER